MEGVLSTHGGRCRFVWRNMERGKKKCRNAVHLRVWGKASRWCTSGRLMCSKHRLSSIIDRWHSHAVVIIKNWHKCHSSFRPRRWESYKEKYILTVFSFVLIDAVNVHIISERRKLSAPRPVFRTISDIGCQLDTVMRNLLVFQEQFTIFKGHLRKAFMFRTIALWQS